MFPSVIPGAGPWPANPEAITITVDNVDRWLWIPGSFVYSASGTTVCSTHPGQIGFDRHGTV
jgi:hypothetical protein